MNSCNDCAENHSSGGSVLSASLSTTPPGTRWKWTGSFMSVAYRFDVNRGFPWSLDSSPGGPRSREPDEVCRDPWACRLSQMGDVHVSCDLWACGLSQMGDVHVSCELWAWMLSQMGDVHVSWELWACRLSQMGDVHVSGELRACMLSRMGDKLEVPYATHDCACRRCRVCRRWSCWRRFYV